MKTWLTFLLFFTCLSGGLVAQRSYKNASVLSSGSWYKIAINAPGIYKVDIAVLNKLGITGQSFPSAAIRLYGNGGSMLPESCSATVTDDLVENAIQVVDGGDGVLNGGDYFLFYATGPHQWTPDSINKRFRHQFNLYSNHSYYYITISGSGKRLPAQPATQPANTIVTSFSERFFHELDSVNFLSSGKEWFGEELSGLPGKSLSASFPLPYTDVLPQPAVLVANCAARSIGAASRFQVNASNSQVLQLDINATTNTNTDIFANENQSFASFVPTAAPVVGFQFTAGGINAQGWINWFEVFCRRPLVQPATSALSFRDWNSVAPGNIAEWRISNGAQAQVWDVTDPFNAVRMSASINGTTLSFTNEASRLREYVVFNNSFLNPEPIGPVPNQNLHASGTTDMIIIAFEATRTEASRLATFHQQKNGLRTVVVTAEQIYNEFSSGIPDPTALRDFAKMYFDKAGIDSVSRPDYLLLFGDASFDYKKRLTGNTNFVPAYQSANALDPLSTYTSDDFFGFLNDHEDINSAVVVNQLDLGIGRVPARNNAEARSFVNKIFAYHEPKSLGPWRNEHTFIADDEDFNLHLNDAEIITAAAATTNPLFIQEKIYLDAFNQESNTAGARYPEVNRAISNQVQAGTLIWNYSGHGGFRRLAEEVVLEQEIVNSWNNPDRLPLFITATCDFAPYDNPVLNSLGENILLREKTGAIALMTTTRLVFAFSNRIMNRNYLQFALQPAVDGNYLSLGDAIRKAKNFTYINQADIVNNRKFTLLGDPAMTLAFPKNKVETVAINGVPITSQADTLKALEKYNIDGQVTDNAGAVISGFNGTVYATVFDKPKAESTRANDPDSY
ncbi:MAG: type IX secretion system sortase PorU, partial [Gemmatimonadaceae bacterium]|nr:type IX secretion system sortase PorU [Chitinophagaceae bacterium]